MVTSTASVPGGGAVPYDEGDTATHEIGHWLGLYHTFQGACTVEDNEVLRTRRREIGGVRLPVGRDFLLGRRQPGLDPITNFMDYTDDACMNTFSGGEVCIGMDSLHGGTRGTLPSSPRRAMADRPALSDVRSLDPPPSLTRRSFVGRTAALLFAAP